MKRLLKSPKDYVLILCAYLANALYASYILFYQNKSAPRNLSDVGVVVPLLIGMSAVILLIPMAIRRTSLGLEKAVVVITGILFALCVVDYLRDLGVEWFYLPEFKAMFMIVSWVAAILSSILTLVVCKSNEVNT
jgi:hypothetical protein